MLHFTTRAAWGAATATGEYWPDSAASEGFVHLSFGHQVARVATERARGASDLVLLVIDPATVQDALRIEDGFPHVYRPIDAASVRLVVGFPAEPDGSFQIPEAARLAELALVAPPTAGAALARARSLMAGFREAWWLGGGWAVDAALGETTRPHLDLDIVVLRRHVALLIEHLAGWDLRIARDGNLPEWQGGDFGQTDHQLWARPDDGFRPSRWQDFACDPGFVEFLVEECEADETWVYRRNPAVRAPVARLGPEGGFLAIEVALLYKSSSVIGSDAAKAKNDFERALPHLSGGQRAWLASALEIATPGHPWGRALMK